MLDASSTLLALTSRTYFDVMRLHSMTEWWHWMVLIAVAAAITSLLITVYRRDAVELPKGAGVLLITLRLIAFLGLLIFFMDIEKRTERKLVKPSRVSMLIDTSQSMGLSDSVTQASTTPQSRLARFVEELSQGELLRELRKKHDVTVYRFARNAVPEMVATFSKTSEGTVSQKIDAPSVATAASFREARRLYILAAIIFALAGVALLAHIFLGRLLKGAEGESWGLLAAGLLLIVAVVVTAVTNLRHPTLAITAVMKGDANAALSETQTNQPSDEDSSEEDIQDPDIDWAQQLVARGTETRVGDAIQWVVERERGGPLAGVILVTDGRSNAGIEPELAAAQAKEALIPVFPIGAGSEKTPKSVRVLDLEAPPRVFPGDNFTMTAYVQAEGLEGRSVKIELVSSDTSVDNDVEAIEREQRLTLGPDGQITPVKFELTPDQIGQRRWVFRIQAPREDLDAADNEKSANVEVVERKNQVLLLAGGPTREYRFLRNLLYRDKDTTLHVLLQSSSPGAAQEANELLSEFPDSRESMFEYDCVVAFDPDWRKLTTEQIELLDQWVAEKAGGLIVVAGPVFTPQWTRSRQDAAKLSVIKGLYPVAFYERSSAGVFLGRYSADTAWPLKFTDEGESARFLALGDTSAESQQAWSDFDGVYGFQAVKDLKRGARVYAYFSDPQAAVDDDLPVFMAGQFYGAGRVFFLGSGELWRLRAVDDSYFERLYTNLIRYVSQGRLLRDSIHGILLVDKERCSLGDSVTVRATLSDSQYRPLTVPSVTATILHESGLREPLIMRQVTNSEREGMYSGQFTTVRQGDYRIVLPVPDIENEMLTREVRVRLPALEIERPQRNDALLSQIAKVTDGAYFVSLDAAKGQRGTAPLTNRIAAKDQETYLPGTPDRGFERRLMTWLLTIICGALSLEWLIRRLNKLA